MRSFFVDASNSLYSAIIDNPVSQIVGFAALLILAFSYQQKDQRKIMQIQIVSGVFFTVQYLLLKEYTGMMLNIVGILRAFVYSNRTTKKWADHIYFPIAFSVASAVAGALTYDKPISLLPSFAMVIAAFVLWLKDSQKIRALTLPTSLMWLTYNFAVGSVAGVIAELLSETSIYIGLFRHRKSKSQSNVLSNN